jgi:hypothetical protein
LLLEHARTCARAAIFNKLRAFPSSTACLTELIVSCRIAA